MKNPISVVLSLGLLLLVSSCQSYRATTYDFPRPVDTTDKPINPQVKKTYELNGIFLDNQFDGARLNDVNQAGDCIEVVIEPENKPINPSAYYAFKIWSSEPRSICLQFKYPEEAYHRYWPKLSHDGNQWTLIDSSLIQVAADTSTAKLKLELSQDTLWVAAQELYTSTKVKAWCQLKFVNRNDKSTKQTHNIREHS